MNDEKFKPVSSEQDGAALSDSGRLSNLSDDPSDDLANVTPDEEASYSESAGDSSQADLSLDAAEAVAESEEQEEQEEVLPAEFLTDPEALSSVFPRDDLDEDELDPTETVLMSPADVRRMAGRAASKRVSGRRGSGSAAATRRSRREDEESLTPEQIAARRRNDLKAKVLIYCVILVLLVGFLALFTYKLPGIMPDTFPNGIWPWNRILSIYTGDVSE